MSIERLNELKQQLSTLTTDEKLDLAAYLTEQARKDKEAEFAASSASNGQQEEPDPYRRRERQWLEQHRSEYAGQCVALAGDRLVAHGLDWKSVLAEARAAGVARPLMVRIESPEEVPFAGLGGWKCPGN